MAQKDFSRFAEMCARLIPRDVSVTISERMPGNLDPEDWQLAVSVFQAIKDALPDATRRQPGEVLAFVLEAIRAHDAKLIEGRAAINQSSDSQSIGEEQKANVGASQGDYGA